MLCFCLQLEFSDDIVKIIQAAINSDGGQPEIKKANSMVKSFFIRVNYLIAPSPCLSAGAAPEQSRPFPFCGGSALWIRRLLVVVTPDALAGSFEAPEWVVSLGGLTLCSDRRAPV